MTWWQAVILGLVQGLTEFLPVSSSGHLVLGQHVLGIELTEDVAFEVMLHLGTALSIVTVYRHRIKAIVSSMVSSLPSPIRAYQAHGEARFGWQIVLATIPVGLAYVFFGSTFERTFAYPTLACAMLVVTGGLLWLTKLAPSGQRTTTWASALLTGLAQTAALLPGMSRSGATICTGLYLRIDSKSAADFSFLMVLPPILGAALLKGMELAERADAIDWIPILLGAVVAYISGIWAIRMVLQFVRKGRLHYFAYYCVGAGLIGWIMLTVGYAP